MKKIKNLSSSPSYFLNGFSPLKSLTVSVRMFYKTYNIFCILGKSPHATLASELNLNIV